jgi:ADP-heptose:LPS heptosyltransferase
VAVRDHDVVLTLRASGLGDLLTAVPALRAVHAATRGARHVLATSPGLRGLAGLVGAFDEVIPARVPSDAPLPCASVDLAVNLHGSGPQSHRLLLDCDPRRMVAFACPTAGVQGPQWDPEEHEVTRWCRLLAESGIPADPDDLDLSAPPGPLPAGVRSATLLHPGAAAPARRWPLERWAKVAAAELADDRPVIVTVGPGERPLGDALARAVPGVKVVDCAADVGMLVRAVDAAQAVVCGDTGVAHLATALRTPSVVLFGPEPPSRWGPPPSRPWHVALWAGRFGDPHATRPDPGLLELGVDDVLHVLPAVRSARRRPAAVPGLAQPAACAS